MTFPPNRPQIGSLTFERQEMIEVLRAIAHDLENGGSYEGGWAWFTTTDNAFTCTISINAKVLDAPPS